MVRYGLVGLLALLLILGCQTKEAKLVGTWKSRPVEAQDKKNFAEVARAGMMNIVAQNLTIEFNKEGGFKASTPIGAGTGTYKWEGEELVLTFNSMAPQQPLRFKFADGGKVLEQSTEFASDPKLFLDKINP